MVIEWLKVRVNPDKREQYIQKDDEIWTAALAKHAGFLGKEVWISPDDLSEVVLVIYWESFEKWGAIPSDELQRTEAAFKQALGDVYQLVGSSRYQVRKFIQA